MLPGVRASQGPTSSQALHCEAGSCCTCRQPRLLLQSRQPVGQGWRACSVTAGGRADQLVSRDVHGCRGVAGQVQVLCEA